MSFTGRRIPLDSTIISDTFGSMNSLVLGFFFTAGMGWALCETCLIAGAGNWLPLILFLLFFIVAFSILGCLDMSDKAMNMFGSVSAVMLGAGLMVFALDSFSISKAVGALKILGALIFLVAGLLTLIPSKSGGESHSH